MYKTEILLIAAAMSVFGETKEYILNNDLSPHSHNNQEIELTVNIDSYTNDSSGSNYVGITTANQDSF